MKVNGEDALAVVSGAYFLVSAREIGRVKNVNKHPRLPWMAQVGRPATLERINAPLAENPHFSVRQRRENLFRYDIVCELSRPEVMKVLNLTATQRKIDHKKETLDSWWIYLLLGLVILNRKQQMAKEKQK